jgi:hypothetical protein
MAYTFHGLQVGSTYIPSTQASVDPAVMALVTGAGGAVDVVQAAVGGTKPIVTFTTPALGTAAGVAAASPKKLSDGTGGANLTLYFAKLLNGSTYASGSVHTSVTVHDGMMVMNRIAGQIGQFATADYTVFATDDGVNSPFEIATDVSLPSADLLAELYVVHSAVIAYSSTSVQVKLNNASLDLGWREAHERAASGIHPTIAAGLKQEPTMVLETMDCKTMLDVCGAAPLVSTGTTLYFAKMDGPTYASGSVHLSILANDPLVELASINAAQDDVASLTYNVHPVYQDATVPLTFSASAALPSAVQLANLFTIGPASFNSVTHESTRFTVNSGNSVQKLSSQGVTYPTVAAVTKREPTVTGEVLNVDETVQTFGGEETNAVLYLRKLDEGGTRVADATEEHISLTFPAALAFSNAIAGQWGDAARQAFTLRPVKSGVNSWVSIDTTAAIA